ncbi:type IV pilus modification PilV family protein [Cohnella hashimotonis]|uniref:Prepilin-type N-terminal cleavage/methylation domain-containing protein n=1 Tax=Cohnella hashimotonis TaxID=2826895 RepID=A0ABT6TBV5_9BACL|nr:prepilin-type N-terminal cleavage/methylation domain-containing protein [Cohnella hashimotonis]MDI4644313.1 prepilin-type N-terminal cleavage/methylation domain-containing protein [Cohnella hashimotonis]
MRTWLHKRRTAEEGFSLIEVLAAITILSIVSLAMTAFFIQAMSYAKGNQNKTVAVNLARNALFFVEKQSFDEFNKYFKTHLKVDSANCTYENNQYNCKNDEETENLFRNIPGLWGVLNTNINGKEYQLTIEYEDQVLKNTPEDPKKRDLAAYLIPIKVVTNEKNAKPASRGFAEVGGYITDEKIR